MIVRLIEKTSDYLLFRQYFLSFTWSEYIFYNDGDGVFTSKTGKGSMNKNRFCIFARKNNQDSYPYRLYFLFAKDIKAQHPKLINIGSTSARDFKEIYSFFKTNNFTIKYTSNNEEFANP